MDSEKEIGRLRAAGSRNSRHGRLMAAMEEANSVADGSCVDIVAEGFGLRNDWENKNSQ